MTFPRGYRSYSPEQLERDRTIRKLRELDMPLLEMLARAHLATGNRAEAER